MTVAGPAKSQGRPRPGRRRPPIRSNVGFAFVSGYALFLLAFGLLPALYALYLSFTDESGQFAGVANFSQVINDYRFWPAVVHVASFVGIWLVCLIVLVVVLALVVHSIRVRWFSHAARFIFYIPGALAGASSVLLWIFVLDPVASPVGFFLNAIGLHSFVQSILPAHLPIVFTVIAFWTGAGGWIVIMFGALNNISSDVMEAARIDGANAIQTAIHIQLPMMRKWIYYMGILSLAAGTQLFVEPQLVSEASIGVVGNDYSLNQVSYLYAFQQNNFNGSAALSILLLVVSLGLASVFVARGGLFERAE